MLLAQKCCETPLTPSSHPRHILLRVLITEKSVFTRPPPVKKNVMGRYPSAASAALRNSPHIEKDYAYFDIRLSR